MTNTPETDELRDDIWATSYVEGSDFAQMFEHSRKLERERDEAREIIATIEIRHAAVMLHTQSIVDEANQFREQRDRLAENLEIALNATVLNHRNDRWHMDAEHTLQLIKQND